LNEREKRGTEKLFDDPQKPLYCLTIHFYSKMTKKKCFGGQETFRKSFDEDYICDNEE